MKKYLKLLSYFWAILSPKKRPDCAVTGNAKDDTKFNIYCISTIDGESNVLVSDDTGDYHVVHKLKFSVEELIATGAINENTFIRMCKAKINK